MMDTTKISDISVSLKIELPCLVHRQDVHRCRGTDLVVVQNVVVQGDARDVSYPYQLHMSAMGEAAENVGEMDNTGFYL